MGLSCAASSEESAQVGVSLDDQDEVWTGRVLAE
jgi:hypothetical protein